MFHLSGAAQGWVAVGFSEDRRMVSARERTHRDALSIQPERTPMAS